MKSNFIITILFMVLFSFGHLFGTDNKINHRTYGYYEPESWTQEPINYYSIIHFVEYGILSLIKSITYLHVFALSIIWEILELFIHYEWARESWGNKLFDIFFNFLGFQYFRKRNKRR